MITEAVINAFMAPGFWLMGLFPSFSGIQVPQGVIIALKDITAGLAYILPVSALMPILYFSMVEHIGKFVVALVVRIKSFIPTMGA